MTSSIIVNIEKLAYGGSGIGRIDGKVCFVPYSAPGDRVSVKILEDKKSYLTAEIDKFVKKSESRISSPCPIFMECGGCNWQHIDYNTQLFSKKQILAEMLYMKGRISTEVIENVIPSPQRYNYRSRMQFKLRYIDSQIVVGFYRTKTHRVVNLPENGCLLADGSINNALNHFKGFVKSLDFPEMIQQLDISTDESGSLHGLIHFIGDIQGNAAAIFDNRFTDWSDFSSLSIKSGRKSTVFSLFSNKEFTYSVETDRSYTLKVRIGGFSQVNIFQNKKLVSIVYDMLSLKPVVRLLDLYCGNGNLSIPSASSALSVTGVEAYDGSISDASENSKSNSIENVRWIKGKVTDLLARFINEGEIFDTVIIDPPRSGAIDAVKSICELGAKRVIYVSCDPATLARDAAAFVKNGFRTVKVVPVDMFPQTYHIETVLYMEKC